MTSTAHHGELAHDEVLKLDAWLQRPDVRITRALKGKDWSTSEDVFGALELAPDDRLKYELVLNRLVGSGHVQRRARTAIDQPARYQLVRELEPPVKPKLTKRSAYDQVGPRRWSPENPGYDGEERDGWFFWRGSWRLS